MPQATTKSCSQAAGALDYDDYERSEGAELLRATTLATVSEIVKKDLLHSKLVRRTHAVAIRYISAICSRTAMLSAVTGGSPAC